jgi:ElaB/YqjD/DUF883 family membrane-anchored ribosome-binding protein
MANNLYQSLTDTATDKANELGEKIADGAADVQSRLSNFGRHAAEAIDENITATAAYVREHDGGRMMHDLKRVVRNNPGPSLLVAIAIGFLAGRTLTRNPRA